MIFLYEALTAIQSTSLCDASHNSNYSNIIPYIQMMILSIADLLDYHNELGPLRYDPLPRKISILVKNPVRVYI